MELMTFDWNIFIWQTLMVFAIVLMVYCLYDILTHSFEQEDKLVWILVIFLIPLSGSIFYLISAKRKDKIA